MPRLNYRLSLILLSVSTACSSTPPPMEICEIDSKSDSLACTDHKRAQVIRTMPEVDGYVCTPALDFKSYIEFCK